MKIKFNRAALQEALGLVTTIVPSRTPKPILECVRITSEVDAVTIAATNLEVGINYQVLQVEIIEPGDIVVPATKLLSIVRESNDEVVEITESESTIHIKGADSHFTIYGHEPSQFPVVPGFEGDGDLELGLSQLQAGIELSVFAAAKESTRYALNGILWEVDGDKLTLVATDGRRLAKSIVTLAGKPTSFPESRVIVPARTMLLLDRLAGAEAEVVKVRFMDNQIVAACGNAIISSNLVEGNFPKYDDIIPKGYTNMVSLGTEVTLSAVKRAALLANEDSKGIKLSLKADRLTFSSRAPETGDAKVEMAVEYPGEPMDIGFNPQFWVDVLRVIKDNEFTLELGDPDRPGLIRCGENFLYIVMPVNL